MWRLLVVLALAGCGPRVQSGEIVRIHNQIGPDYIMDLEFDICFAVHRDGMVTIPGPTCRKMMLKYAGFVATGDRTRVGLR